uniref:Uncharacterized protein n=1 Tax=Lotharella globosa TaxID=91324 RepID=A0A7S3YYB8_9EUKA
MIYSYCSEEFLMIERPVESFSSSEIRMTRISLDTPIDLPVAPLPGFRLLHIVPAPPAAAAAAASAPSVGKEKEAPSSSATFALLGELDKWVPASPQRIVRADSHDGNDGHHGHHGHHSMSITARGAPGESVSLSFARVEANGTLSLVSVECPVGAAGTVVVTVPENGCMHG